MSSTIKNSIICIFEYLNHLKISKHIYYTGHALFSVIAMLLLAFGLRAVSLHLIVASQVWKIHISDDSIKLIEKVPGYADKEGLVQFGKIIIGNDNLTTIDKTKKPILKNLASLYYSNKPY